MDYPGIDGFLGTRGSAMLDFVFIAMFLVVPVLLVSIWLVKKKRRFALHKKIQITLGVVLLTTITAFELDMRFGGGWQERAEPSPYWGTDEGVGWVWWMLWIHLFFSITTTILWIVVMWRALLRFSRPPAPGDHSPSHVFWAWIASMDLVLTAITGNWFYYLAFVAS